MWFHTPKDIVSTLHRNKELFADVFVWPHSSEYISTDAQHKLLQILADSPYNRYIEQATHLSQRGELIQKLCETIVIGNLTQLEKQTINSVLDIIYKNDELREVFDTFWRHQRITDTQKHNLPEKLRSTRLCKKNNGDYSFSARDIELYMDDHMQQAYHYNHIPRHIIKQRYQTRNRTLPIDINEITYASRWRDDIVYTDRSGNLYYKNKTNKRTHPTRYIQTFNEGELLMAVRQDENSHYVHINNRAWSRFCETIQPLDDAWESRFLQDMYGNIYYKASYRGGDKAFAYVPRSNRFYQFTQDSKGNIITAIHTLENREGTIYYEWWDQNGKKIAWYL